MNVRLFWLAASAMSAALSLPAPARAIECTTYVYNQLSGTKNMSALKLASGGAYGNADVWYDRAKANTKGAGVSAKPSVGAIMVFASTNTKLSASGKAFPSYGKSLNAAIGITGHVALIKAVDNTTTIRVDHANWRKDKVDTNVRVSTGDDGKKVPLWTTAKVQNNVGASVIQYGANYNIAGFISASAFPAKKK